MTTAVQTTTPTGGAAAATAQASRSATAKSTSIASDFNTFLTLLTTQLKNQDPTNAMSPEEMTSQLVQFSQVEQQIRMNDGMETLISLQQTAQLTAAAPLIGQMVEVESDRLSLQDGKAALRLPAAGAAQEAVIQIQDGAGRLLRQDRVALGAAAKDWTWDGRNGAGVAVPDGPYRFTVSGRDLRGEAVALPATVRARATGAERRDGALMLGLGGLEVGFEKLRSLVGR